MPKGDREAENLDEFPADVVPSASRAPEDSYAPLIGRYVLGRRIGAGSFGIVHEARDLSLQTQVALKRLRAREGAALLRFKQEFRQLADIAHPNLVRLHQLFAAGGDWYIAMDLVHGDDFVSAVRPGGVLSEPRLRAALAQLAAGVHALNTAGKLHRDLKPRNVLVRHDGVVQILDFGLIAQLSPSGAHETHDGGVRGTPAYMAPEQARGEAITTASDWYAVGAMLYEALTGVTPFGGATDEAPSPDRECPPHDPRLLMAGQCEDLCDLCVALLDARPERRPTGPMVLERLAHSPHAPASMAPRLALESTAPPFIGRRSDLEALLTASAAQEEGRAAVVLLHGPSGIGKTALVRHFERQLKVTRPDTIVLAGRCYEHESVPYKAFDQCMDELTTFLLRLAPLDVERIMPRDVHALARLFPVLHRVPAVGRGGMRAQPIGDAQELRRRAFAALRDLLSRACEQWPLVLHLDDLQWGDADSAALLLDLLRPPAPPPFLLIAGYRSEDAARSECLAALAEERRRNVDDCFWQEIPLGPLPQDDALALTQALLASGGSAAHDPAAIARESMGSPFFVHELVRFVTSAACPPERAFSEPASLGALLSARVSVLTPEARRVLEVVAVGGPIAATVTCRAAGVDADAGARALAALKGASLLRARPSETEEDFETYHDRVRETVVMLLGERAAAVHRTVAEALEAVEGMDPERLHEHFRRAGDTARACTYAERGAERAIEALAFDRAAALYGAVLELAPAREWPLRLKYAEALARAGRGVKAAEAFLRAVESAPEEEKLRLRRCAAEQFLLAGHLEEGLATLRSVLGSLGLSLPPTPKRAVASLLYHRARLRLRGQSFRERPLDAIAPETLLRADVCWATGLGLCNTDMVRGMDFITRHLRLALDAGEPSRIARGLALEALFTASGGGSNVPRAERLLAQAQVLASRTEDPQALALIGLGTGIARWNQFRTAHAAEAFRTTLELLHKHKASGWELGSAQYFRINTLLELGELAEICRLAPAAVQDARSRGDVYTETSLRLAGMTWYWLCADRPQDAADNIAEAMVPWTKQGFHLQHFYGLVSLVRTLLYSGQYERALDAVRRAQREVARSQLLRVELIHIHWLEMQARCFLAAAQVSNDRERLLREAERCARLLAGRPGDFPKAMQMLALAGVAYQRGDRDRAQELLVEGERRGIAAGFLLRAAAMRRRRGQILAGPEGPVLVDAVDAWLCGQGVRKPAIFAAVLAPGFD